MNFKSLFINVTTATAMAVGAVGFAGGNAAEARSLPHYNQPVNGGTTTLRQKCLAAKDAERNYDFGRLIDIGVQMVTEHNTPVFQELSQDCASVGVYGVF